MKRFVDVASLVGLHGMKGRLIARSCDGLPFLLEPGMIVHFVPPGLRDIRTTKVLEVTFAKADDYYVMFKDVTTRDEAQALVGKHCLVAQSELEGATHVTNYDQLQGFDVIDTKYGKLGTLSHIEHFPGHSLLAVNCTTNTETLSKKESFPDEGKTILIPLADEIINEISDENRSIYVTVPAGLLAL
ncbi:MAG: 16S rRNA processing protein RimM [Eggerthellaceae bacterium]|nr:16S rRNA processing protein RimM [Eggerthellaceae bacterium]